MADERKAKSSRWIVLIVAVSMLLPLGATGAVVYFSMRTPAETVASSPRLFDDASRVVVVLAERFGNPPRVTRVVVHESRVEAEASDAGDDALFTFGEADATIVPKLVRGAQAEVEPSSAKPARLVLERAPGRGYEPVWTVHFDDASGAAPVVFSRSGALLRERR